MTVDIDCIAATDLTPGLMDTWSRIQRSNTDLDSPYFRPEFTRAVSSVRGDVSIAVFRKDGNTVGFFPFQQHRFHIGRPIGSFLSDFHGVIASPNLSWDWGQFLESCSLRGFEYDHLTGANLPARNCSVEAFTSPYIDLSEGFDAYLSRRKAATREISQTLRKARKAAREVGPIRFVYQDTNPLAWKSLIEWKTAQFQQTNATDAFAYKWSNTLLNTLLETKESLFKGVLSTLYFGDRLAAVHFGMSTDRVLHWWFPSYDVGLSHYSPGLILLLETAKTAALQGITRIDLGKGKERYKRSFMSDYSTVHQGAVDVTPLLHNLRIYGKATRRRVMGTPIGWAARGLVNQLRKMQQVQ